MNPAVAAAMAFFLFFFILGFMGILVLPRKTNESQADQPRRTRFSWPVGGVILAIAIYLFESVSSHHLIQGISAVELVLGQLLGVPLFGPLSDRILRRTYMGNETMMVIILASQISGPLLAYAVFAALGLQAHGFGPFVHSMVR